jgi:hypothetical protein
MPIQSASDNQKVDYLWKKIVYGAAKTDISGNIDATNEPNPSPLLIRGDKILQQSDLIANIIPGSNSSVVTVYPTTFPVECTSTAGIPTPSLTWQTGQTFWIPPEFGSTYQIKVYISPSGQAANVLTKGTQVFATGSGNNDLWVFDYQAGILNFNSNNTPYAGGSPISFTGNSVYISGAVYSGAFGLPTASNIGNVILGNITFSGNTISSNQANGNIMIFAPGQGIVQFVGQDAIGLPSGDDSTRPLYPVVGYTRFNTSRQSIEYYDGTQWLAPGEAVISSQTINPDGSANTFALSSNTSTAGVLVSINGTLQQPIDSYVIVNNNQIQFTEIPLTTDTVEVRYISVGAVTVGSLQFQNTTSVILDAANVNVTGNILPSANVTYSLGSETLQWKDLWVSGNTVYIGGSALTVANGQLSIGGNTVGSAVTYSNVNVKAYTESMGFQNYSNVNLSAYLGGSFSIGTITGGSWNGGTIGVLYGGTGGTTPTEALTSLLPSGASTGYVLTTGGAGSYYWSAVGGGGGATVGQTINTLRQSNTATQGQTVFTLTGNISYTPGSGQLGVYINGVRQFPTEYTETASNVFTLTTGINAGDVVFAEINRSQSFNNYANLTYASNVGNISASGLTVQAAIESLENNKAPLSNPVFSGVTTIGGNLVVQGNLFVNGNLTTINANNLVISDSMIYLADDNPTDTLDIGIVSAFTSAVRYQHTGFVRDATDGVWKLFANVVAEPTTTIDFNNATYANLQVGNLLVGSYRQPAVTGFGIGGGDGNPGGIQFGDPNLIGGRANIVVSSFTYITLHAVGNITYRAAEQHEFVNEVHATSDLYAVGNVFLAAGNNPSSRVNVHASTTSTSTTTGAVVVRGGVGIGGNLNVGGNITATVSGFAIGYRDLPQITAGNVTLALSDASEHFYANTGAPTTITVPSNANVAFPIGTTIVIVNRGAGNVTIQNQGAGAPFLYLAGNATTTTSRTLTQYGMATLLKTETNLWFVNGTGLV